MIAQQRGTDTVRFFNRTTEACLQIEESEVDGRNSVKVKVACLQEVSIKK